jgi:hypothetical protein
VELVKIKATTDAELFLTWVTRSTLI